MDIVEGARLFSIGAHSGIGQKRKYTGEPYWVHTHEVADLVSKLDKATPEMIAAAHLHDTVEDTHVTLDLITEAFGDTVSELVYWLTDVSKPTDGNRATRKAIDRAHTANAPREAQMIKVCDLMSNTRSIVAHDPDFAKVYIKEKIALLEAMTKIDPDLKSMAMKVIEESKNDLSII